MGNNLISASFMKPVNGCFWPGAAVPSNPLWSTVVAHEGRQGPVASRWASGKSGAIQFMNHVFLIGW